LFPLIKNFGRKYWVYRVHEEPNLVLHALGVPIRRTHIAIDHLRGLDDATHDRKRKRNTRLLLMDLDEHPDDPKLRRMARSMGVGEALQTVSAEINAISP
jgi:hypothetical protein